MRPARHPTHQQPAAAQPAARPGAFAWLVGAFALWQVAFPVLANVWELIPRRPTPADSYPELSATQRWGRFTRIEWAQSASERAGDGLAVWGEVTGQEQGWNMFTPDFPPHTVVPIAELHFADGTAARLPSRFAPADPDHPGMRWPLIHDREFNYEANITMIGWHADPESVAASPEVWSRLPASVRTNNELVSHWLACKARAYRTSNPGTPDPVEVVLIFRYIPTREPGEAADAPRKPTFERPFARWFPAGPRAPGLLPLEGYDPVEKRYVPLSVVTPP
jgi:hypothetical protein